MSTEYAEFHDELRRVARDVLGRSSPLEGGGSPTRVDWSVLVDTGWLGLDVSDALDGAGATFAEVAVIAREVGRAAALTAYFGSTVLGVGVLEQVSRGPERDDLLRAVATGRVRVAVALETGDAVDPPPPMTVEGSGATRRIVGSSPYTFDALDADRLLLVARDGDGAVVANVARDEPGLTIAPQPMTDGTRDLARVDAAGVECRADSLWRFDDPDALSRLFDRAALAIASDSLGLAECMLDTTVEYARVRQQFGRPIGSFQAVKHGCAEMLVKVVMSRELLDLAVSAMVRGADDVSVAVSQAKSAICDAAVDVAGAAMQFHGGIGYTWERGVHAYLKRALLNRSLFGSASAHRQRLARRYHALANAGVPRSAAPSD